MSLNVLGSDDDETPEPEPLVEDQTDPTELQALVEDLIQDPEKASILAWVLKAQPSSSLLDFRALQTALALFSAPNSTTIQELEAHKPTLNAESLGKFVGTIFNVANDRVSIINDSVRDFLDSSGTLDNLGLWQDKDLDILIAGACVTYLSLDDFRDLPLPSCMKGLRIDLATSDPFLTYASCYWHRHIRSPEEAKLFEPRLSQILDPGQNNLALWMDQSNTGLTSGAPFLFRSQSEVAIKRDIPWLAAYLLKTSGSSGPENLFPARDLARNVRTAPETVVALIKRKPDYYLPAVTKKFFIEALRLYRGSLDIMKAIIPSYKNACLPAAILKQAAESYEGDKILELLFSTLKEVPITDGMLAAAAGNNPAGKRILKLLFQKRPDIRVTKGMISRAFDSSTDDELLLLFEHDRRAPIDEDLLIKAVQVQKKSIKMRYILGVRPETRITTRVLRKAISLSRYSTVKLFFEHDNDLKMTEDLLKVAAGEGHHGMETLQFLLGRSDPALVTTDVLLAGTRRPNSPHKAIEVLLSHNPKVKISEKVMIESIKGDLNGNILDHLLKQRGGQAVTRKVVDEAIKCHERLLTWTWRSKDEPTSLKILQKRVPENPYLKRKLQETNSKPPLDTQPKHTNPLPTAIPDVASRGDVGNLRKLLDEGFDANASHGTSCGCDHTDGKGTALQRASKQRNLAMVKLLLEHGAHPDLQEGEYGNPLQEATIEGDLELVKLLFEHKASINYAGGRHGSPLIAASKADDVNIVRYLLDQGADINFNDGDGWTPYLHAVASESYDVIRYLSGVEPSLASIGELIALPPGKMTKAREKSTVGISEDGLTITSGKFLLGGSLPHGKV